MPMSCHRIKPIQKNGRARLLVELKVGENTRMITGEGVGSDSSDGSQAREVPYNSPEPQRHAPGSGSGPQMRRSTSGACTGVTSATEPPVKRLKLGDDQVKKCDVCRRQNKKCTHDEGESFIQDGPVPTAGRVKGKAPLIDRQWLTFPDNGVVKLGSPKPARNRVGGVKTTSRNKISFPPAVIGNPYSHIRNYESFYMWSTNPDDPKAIDDKMTAFFKTGPIALNGGSFAKNPIARSSPPPRPENDEDGQGYAALAFSNNASRSLIGDTAVENLSSNAVSTSNDTSNKISTSSDPSIHQNGGIMNKNTEEGRIKLRKYKSYGGYVFEFDSDLESE